MSSLNGETVVLGQHTGPDVQLRVYGDEFYGRYETPSGYTVVYDTDYGGYCYAEKAAGNLVSTGVPIGKPIPANLRKHLKEDPDVRNEKFGVRYAQLHPPEVEVGSIGTRTFGPDNGLLSGRKLHTGDVRGLTILVEFDDVRMSITQADVEQMLNADGYTGQGNFSSVREYFNLVSNGQLNYSNTVVGPIRLAHRRSHYLSTLLVEEALDAVVNDLNIDLRNFDSRREGIVDAINILYAGESQYVGQLWPHNSVEELQYGAVRTHFYLLTGLGAASIDLRIGTICHENGHLLCRFPDMYDYGERDGDHEKSQGIGRYCLMGSGNHLNDRRTPSPVCSYLRELAGWADNLILLNAPGSQVAAHGDYGTVMKYELDIPNEYFLVENRSQQGLDSHLPDSGLAVYHCDTLGSNEWQNGTRNQHYQCALLQADGHLDLENNRNAGDSGDLFADVSSTALSHATTPSTRRWDDSDSGLTISEIGSAGAEISFTIGDPQIQPQVQEESSPNTMIPDNDDVGIQDTIEIAAVGSLIALSLRVEVFHTWIGDLQVMLEAPDGTKAIVHDKEGHNTRDLMKTYDSSVETSLDVFDQTQIEGTWKLSVIDDVPRDVGRLAHWSLDIKYDKSGTTVVGQSEPNALVPDNSATGVESTIALNHPGTVKEILVNLQIEHTYIGDLAVDLVAPSGASVRLHDHSGGFSNDIDRAYDGTSTPALRGLLGQTVNGNWKLFVRDLAPRDEGRLKSWSIQVTV